MPKEVFDNNYQYLPQSSLLTFEEITRAATSFIALGVEKIRLTGGEPLLRKNLEILISQLAGLQTLNGKPLDRNTQYGDPANFKAALEAAGVK